MNDEALLTYATTFTFGTEPEVVTVEYRGMDAWAVMDGRFCRTDDGWEPEPSASERDNEWFARARYTRDEAVTIAMDLVAGNGC